MDPADLAASQLNAILGRMEVPLTVLNTPLEGKHVQCTGEVDKDVELLEETPIVSWPSPGLLRLAHNEESMFKVYFCFHCLTCVWYDTEEEERKADAVPEGWVRPEGDCTCGALFCSADCQAAASEIHTLLCASLPTLRDNNNNNNTIEEEPVEEDKNVKSCDLGESCIITLESVVKCVAVTVHRLGSAIQKNKLDYTALQEDFAAEGAVLAQLFTHAITPFNRLITGPDNMKYNGINFSEWVRTIQDCLLLPCTHYLQTCAGEETTKTEIGDLTDTPTSWVETLLFPIFKKETLSGFLSQLALNAHAVNDYAFCFACQKNKEKQNTTTSEADMEAGGLLFIKGAALYSILSTLNHSCSPNACVVNQRPHHHNISTSHDMLLKTTRAIHKGEEVCITYIPLDEGSTAASRNELLKSYFFKCRCPRCVADS
ncbi:hypothetical protein AGDE_06050 [Angomonas deanei]|nr:hypothetical protein AGDE_06050 [Angomonas deanei]|eukprot:EPY37883.1 hypothetical protein AGDE_06050 [Angomonas deanei]